MYCKWGSFIDDVDKFDASFFNMAPREAERMDPQLRYLLQVLYWTAEDRVTLVGYVAQIRGCMLEYAFTTIKRKWTEMFNPSNLMMVQAMRPQCSQIDLRFISISNRA